MCIINFTLCDYRLFESFKLNERLLDRTWFTHMQILGILYFLLTVCFVLGYYKRYMENILEFFLMECVSSLKFIVLNTDFGFFLFRSFKHLSNVLCLFMLFLMGLKVLQYGCHCKGFSQFLCDFRGKSSKLKIGFCSKSWFDGDCDPKISSCERGLKFLENSNTPISCKLGENGETASGSDVGGRDRETDDEDVVVDVMSLRKSIKIEKRRADEACLELEKERMAAATAAEEAMAMILRLQNEKSLMDIKYNQYCRLAEEKQQHDQEVIRSLRWIVMKHESERTLLEDQLRLCWQKLIKGGEGDQSDGIDEVLSPCCFKFEDGLSDVLIGSLDKELAPQASCYDDDLDGNRGFSRSSN